MRIVNRLSNAGVTVLVLGAIGLTSFNVYQRASRLPTQVERVLEDWRAYSIGGYRLGPRDASVTVVIFSDYSCPFCAKLWHRAGVILKRYPSSVAVVLRHYPLGLVSTGAARAAVCAAAQGKLEQFSDTLFAHSDSLTTATWREYAQAVDVSDLAIFDDCLNSPESARAVETDLKLGEKVGAFITPTFLVNQDLYAGDAWDFERIVDSHLKLVDDDSATSLPPVAGKAP